MTRVEPAGRPVPADPRAPRRGTPAGVTVRFCDETPFGAGWIAEQPALLERASHALAADGRVWLVDPVAADEALERVRSLGQPVGVVQLLDRHGRDAALLAEHLGIPHHRVPRNAPPGAPFEVLPVVDLPGWREVALWWEAEAVLVFADAVGSSGYFRAPDERLAVHPFLRPHVPRRLRDAVGAFAPRHVLVGHGEGIHGEEAAPALAEAVRLARRRAPRWLRHQIRGRRR